MKHLLLLLCFAPLTIFAQTDGDRTIIAIVQDSTSMYQKVRTAFARNNIQVKELGKTDSVQTFAAEVSGIPGYAVFVAILNGDKVELSGMYGMKRIDDFGYTRSPKNYKPIIFFKGSKTWKLMQKIAGDLEPVSLQFSR